jgi:hypothetical protein
MVWIPRTARSVALGAGAFALTDAITGMAAYCVIVLGALWFFSWSWLRIAAEAATKGVPFGSAAQLQWAWFGTIVALPMIPLVIFLAVRAYRIPVGLAREARHPGTLRLRALVAGHH